MPRSASGHTRHAWLVSIPELDIAIAIAVAFLSMFDRGGNTARAVAFIGWAALAVASFAALTALRQASRVLRDAVTTPLWWMLGGAAFLAIAAVLGQIRVSPETWLSLPGRGAYAPVVDTLSAMVPNGRVLSLSMAADLGLQSLIILLSSVAVALGTALLSARVRFILMCVLLALCVLQALIGVAQLAFGAGSVFTLDYVGHVRATGTFVNKNHFATLLAMMIPFCVARAAIAITDFDRRYDRQRLFFAIWASLAAALVLACASTLSRAGIAAALVVLSLAIGIEVARHARRSANRKRALVVGVLAAVGVAALLASSKSFFSAFTDEGAIGSFAARVQMYEATIRGAAALFPFGSGLGSFAVAFPAFQPTTLRGFVEYAHNDYLQVIFEAGVFGLAAMTCAAVAFSLAVRRWAQQRYPSMQTAYLLGASAFALHALLDFPARIPALALIATFLLTCACTEQAEPPSAHAAEH